MLLPHPQHIPNTADEPLPGGRDDGGRPARPPGASHGIDGNPTVGASTLPTHGASSDGKPTATVYPGSLAVIGSAPVVPVRAAVCEVVESSSFV